MTGVNGVGVDTQPKGTSVVKGAVVAGAVGAGISAAANTGIQIALKKSPKFMQSFKDTVKITSNAYKGKTGIWAKYVNFCNKTSKNMLDTLSKGKFDFKSLGKNAAIAAGLYAGIYLAYRGVKALFTSNN